MCRTSLTTTTDKMPTTWTAERINQLLLLIIKKHIQGTPDYQFLGAQLGVTAEAARLQFGSLRRNFTLPQPGTVQPLEPKSKPRKRKSKATDESDEDKKNGKRQKGKRKSQNKTTTPGNAECEDDGNTTLTKGEDEE